MPNKLLLLSEAATEARVSISTVRHWLANGRLPSVRPGRRRLIRRADFDSFLASDITQRPDRLGSKNSPNGGER